MIIRALLALLMFSAGVGGASGPAAAAKEIFSIGYLQREGDPAYAPHRAYTGLVLRDRAPALHGAKTALRESRILGRSIGVKFDLRKEKLKESDDLISRIEDLIEEETKVFLLDLPLEEVVQAAHAFTGTDVILFNIRHGADELRGPDCSSSLFHTAPSDAMLMDALAQHLFERNWKDVLVLEGEEARDSVVSTAFQAAAKKFGLTIVDVRSFVLSNDPRARDETNIALLTGGAEHDVIFLADSLGEFGRYVPYQTYDPRPVVGSEGLVSSAWHWTWERHGAPQLNQRFDRIAKRRMKDSDYAAWAAVKSVVEAIVRSESRNVEELRDYITSEAFTLDTYKGAPGSFRRWNNQLRQPLLLHTHNAVVARAPLEGFLHQTNNLDTLGRDQPESACRFE